MADRSVHLLHVEDDALQRHLIQAHLATLEGLKFEVAAAASEDEAVAAFGQRPFEFVLLDYQLEQGNGLSCLQRIRGRDEVVPIVAVSGVASPAVAAELLRAGADDFLGKEDLTTEALSKSIRAALARADSFRRRVPARSAEKARLEAQLRKVCQRLASLGPDWLAELDALEQCIKDARATPAALPPLFELTCRGLTPDAAQSRRLFRPILLEMLRRITAAEK
jgi:DNA-binding response OmpR family regulator